MIGRAAIELVLEGNVNLAPSCHIESSPTGSHCIAGEHGSITVGPRTRIGAGAAISSDSSVIIGADVSIGHYVVIQDDDFHTAGDTQAERQSRAVHIEDGVVIGHSVTILPGARLGAGSQVHSGSVVGGQIPAGEIVAGNPARSIHATNDGELRPAQILAHVLSLDTVPSADDEVTQLPGFDSLLLLRMLIEIEEHHGIWLDQHDLADVRTVGELESLVDIRSSQG